MLKRYFFKMYNKMWGHAVVQWLRHCATNQKVAGVIGIFHWHNPSGSTMALRSTQPPTEMNTRNISCGKGGRCVGLTTLPPSCANCLKIWEPQPPRTLSACNGAAYPGILFGGVSTNSVEDRGQRERGCGGGSPLGRGSAQSANEWNPYTYWDVFSTEFRGGRGINPPKSPPLGTPLDHMNYGCQICYGKRSRTHICIAHKHVIVESTNTNMATIRNFEFVYNKFNRSKKKTCIVATSFPHLKNTPVGL
jgi:hypothetical protein